MGVALLALFVALGGTSVALTKGEKKQIRTIAKKQANKRINKRASHLSVNHANSAKIADLAGTANNARNANALGGIPLAGLVPARGGIDNVCDPTSTTFVTCGSTTITTARRAKILVIAMGTWYEDGGSTSVRGVCRIGGASSQHRSYGSTADNTNADHARAVAIQRLDIGRNPGTYTYELLCRQHEGDFEVSDVDIVAVAVDS